MDRVVKMIVEPTSSVDEDLRNMIFACGGIMAASCSSDVSYSEFMKAMPDEIKDRVAPGTKVILVARELIDYVHDENIMHAVELYERGHIECGHLDTAVSAGIIRNETYEHQADDYAVNIVGTETVIKALECMIEFSLNVGIPKLLGRKLDEEEYAAVKERLNGGGMFDRIWRLRHR